METVGVSGACGQLARGIRGCTYRRSVTDLHAVPAELQAAGGPLAQVGHALVALADSRRQVERLADGSPSRELRQALAAFGERWELTIWSLGDEAEKLGAQVTHAGGWYAYHEFAVVDRLGLGRAGG